MALDIVYSAGFLQNFEGLGKVLKTSLNFVPVFEWRYPRVRTAKPNLTLVLHCRNPQESL